MDRGILLALVILFGVFLLVLLPLGWRARQRRQGALVRPVAVPQSLGDLTSTYSGKYVATTTAGDPYDRVAVHGLGFRGDVEVSVTSLGLLLERPGEPDVWIPAADLRGIRRATWTIDRVVEPDGLHLVEWTLGEQAVDTYLRLDEASGFDADVAHLVPTERQPS